MSPTDQPMRHKNACAVCNRRKVKCDRSEPCSNCRKAKVECTFDELAAPRSRKRPAADDEVVARLARYEDLMRRNNIDFSDVANVWIPSGLEPASGLKRSPSPRVAASVATDEGYSTSGISNLDNAVPKRYTWFSLCQELKYPPVQSLRHKEDPSLIPILSLEAMVGSSGTQAALRDVHPEPRHIYHMWQIFAERWNPLIKTVHVPTLQARFMDASWNTSDIAPSLTAIMFAIYTCSVICLSAEECLTLLGETRRVLLSRYQAATVRALVVADFLTTDQLEVLQALTLFLFTVPESELAFSLTGAAIRVGQRMGLHRDAKAAGLPFFEQEMRVRLWWQLCGLDARVRATFLPETRPPTSHIGDIRLPLNINDADLHPNMTEPPAEHTGLTEMACVLIKYEVSNWMRTSKAATRFLENVAKWPVKDASGAEMESEFLKELNSIYWTKYLCKCDASIPLHGLIEAIAKSVLARIRFKLHHPRNRVNAKNGGTDMTREASDMLFEAALQSLEMVDLAMKSMFSTHLFIHLTADFLLDAYVYVLGDLRWRFTGKRVDLAWRLVEEFFNEHSETLADEGNSFYKALGDLALEAWQLRRGEIMSSPSQQAMNYPPFIETLLAKRKDRAFGDVPMASDEHGANLNDALDLTNGADFDWEYWNDFLRI